MADKAGYYRRFLSCCAGAMLFAMCPSIGNAYSIAVLNPESIIPRGEAPVAAHTIALDTAMGLDGDDFLLEDFEDTTLVPGLTVEFGGRAPTATLSVADLISENEGLWDGSSGLGANLILDPFEPLIFRSSLGLRVFAIGISGFQHANELSVNGINLGPLESLRDFVSNPKQNSRNVYIKIECEPEDVPITEVSLLPDPLGWNPVGDHVRVDHVITKRSDIPIERPLLDASLSMTIAFAVLTIGLLLVWRRLETRFRSS